MKQVFTRYSLMCFLSMAFLNVIGMVPVTHSTMQKGDKDEQADNGVSDTFLVPDKTGSVPRWVTLPR